VVTDCNVEIRHITSHYKLRTHFTNNSIKSPKLLLDIPWPEQDIKDCFVLARNEYNRIFKNPFLRPLHG
jgi:hypothetical protein